MKLAYIYGLLVTVMNFAFAGLWPTIKAILRDPSLLLRPAAPSKVFMSHVWDVWADTIDEACRSDKEGVVTPHAGGTVLDVGAGELFMYDPLVMAQKMEGHGHTVHYLDCDKVTKYVALEPNTLMHNRIRAHASKAGFHESDGSLVILPYNADNTSAILSALGGTQVNTIISILTLCSVSSPEKTINAIVRDVLRSGGQLLFFEHVLSDIPDVAWWQRVLAPLWQIPLDGCRIDRPTHVWIERMGVGEVNGVWRERKMWNADEEPGDGLLSHRAGIFVKD